MTVAVPDASVATPPTALSDAMRLGSRAEHELTENTPFVTELVAGRLAPIAYGDLLLRLHRVYTALESAVGARHDDPFVAAVHDAVLERATAIENDLRHWAPGVDPATVVSPATDAYVARIESARGWGGLLLAHHYTRYLGDLSGGRVIAHALTRTFGAGAAVSFYDFAVAKPKLYKDAYRARLDALTPAPIDVERIVTEVRAAFGCNRAVFTELGVQLDRYRR